MRVVWWSVFERNQMTNRGFTPVCPGYKVDLLVRSLVQLVIGIS